jgi:hypothetical protein
MGGIPGSLAGVSIKRLMMGLSACTHGYIERHSYLGFFGMDDEPPSKLDDALPCPAEPRKP